MLSRAEIESELSDLAENYSAHAVNGVMVAVYIPVEDYRKSLESARQLAEWLALLSGPVPVGGGEKREAWEAAFRAYYEWRES